MKIFRILLGVGVLVVAFSFLLKQGAPVNGSSKGYSKNVNNNNIITDTVNAVKSVVNDIGESLQGRKKTPGNFTPGDTTKSGNSSGGGAF